MCSWNLEIVLFCIFIFFPTFFSFNFLPTSILWKWTRERYLVSATPASFIFFYILQAFKWIFSHLSLGLLMPRPPALTTL